MAYTMPLTPGAAPVPTTRLVDSLEAALRVVRDLGGSVASETRTAPGIGSWALVAEPGGNEVVLWEDAIGSGR